MQFENRRLLAGSYPAIVPFLRFTTFLKIIFLAVF